MVFALNAADGLSRGRGEEAFAPREGETKTGRYGLFEEYADDPVYKAVYALAVQANELSVSGSEYHAFGGVDSGNSLVFQGLQRGRERRISYELLNRMAREFYSAYPGGSVLFSIHSHGNDALKPGAYENFSGTDRTFYGGNDIVGAVTGFVVTPRGLLLMHDTATGRDVQIGRVPPVRRLPGRGR